MSGARARSPHRVRSGLRRRRRRLGQAPAAARRCRAACHARPPLPSAGFSAASTRSRRRVIAGNRGGAPAARVRRWRIGTAVAAIAAAAALLGGGGSADWTRPPQTPVRRHADARRRRARLRAHRRHPRRTRSPSAASPIRRRPARATSCGRWSPGRIRSRSASSSRRVTSKPLKPADPRPGCWPSASSPPAARPPARPPGPILSSPVRSVRSN